MTSDALGRFCKQYKRLESDGASYSWSALDGALARVCSTMPSHTAAEEVYAKIRLINRAYLANLQFGTPNAEWKLAEKFVKGKADAVIAPLRSSRDFSAERLPKLLDAHEELVKLAAKVTGKVHNSFVSKYLHFHFPEAVPVFDNYAYDAVWRLAPAPESEYVRYENRVNCDYGCYCGSVLELMKLLRGRGIKSPSLKLLDILLYGMRNAANT